jgi:OOP family OmpA-OmpF porin
MEVASMTLDILFGFDKSQVTPFHYAELQKASEFIERYPMYKVVVEGHTDDQGPADYNQALSQRRADSVSKVLIDKYSVPASRIRSTGFGPTQPVASNATEEERVKNRRVEISIRP